MRNIKRTVATLLALVMLMGMVPAGALEDIHTEPVQSAQQTEVDSTRPAEVERLEEPVNLALNRPATASRTDADIITFGPMDAGKAVDGNTATRWACGDLKKHPGNGYIDDVNWFTVDLGKIYDLTSAKIVWEAARAEHYVIEASNDYDTFTGIYDGTTTGGNGDLTQEADLTGKSGRYIRVRAISEGLAYGISIRELELYGAEAASQTGSSDVVKIAADPTNNAYVFMEHSGGWAKPGSEVTVTVAPHSKMTITGIFAGEADVTEQFSDNKVTFTPTLDTVIRVETARMESKRYEAEDATQGSMGAWVVENNGNASGGKVAGSTDGKEFLFENVPASDSVIMAYASSKDATGTVKVGIKNGDEITELGVITFTNTGDWGMANPPRTAQLTGVVIPEGATISIRPVHAANIDYFEFCKSVDPNAPLDYFEAEDAEHGEPGPDGKQWQVSSDGDASGGKYVGHTDGTQLILKNVIEANSITMRYASVNSGGVSVNLLQDDGTYRSLGQITFATTNGWGMNGAMVDSLRGVYIPAGSTIMLTTAVAVNMDWFSFAYGKLNEEEDLGKDIVLAKNSAMGGGAAVTEDIMSSVGQAVSLTTSGDSVTFTVPELDQDEINTYVLNYFSDAPARVTVQIGADAPETVDLAACLYHSYTTSGKKDVPLNAGDTVTVTLVNGAVKLDYMSFRYAKPIDPAGVVTLPTGAQGRTVLNLDGTWACTSTRDKAAPADAVIPEFDNSIPVPGLWDLASVSMGSYQGAKLWYTKGLTMPQEFDPSGDYRVNLEIRRAQYGRSIYVNGVFVEHEPYNFVNSNTDITKYLNAGENEIVIMLGDYAGQRDDPKGIAHTGFDTERTEYIPGISDSVNIIVSRDPKVEAVQTAPNLENSTVQVRTRLVNRTEAAVTTDVEINIYELGVYTDGVANQVRKLVGTHTQRGVTVAAGETTQVDIPAVAVAGFTVDAKAWCPANPFLYEIEVKTSGDTLSERFGMKTFYFDPETKLPMLNGEVYYLRGTNVAMYRFYEDPMRSDHPWNEDWARQLTQEFLDTNWEVYRTHNGPLPSLWYDIADEMGMMIVDEYAFWYCEDKTNGVRRCTAENLRPEIERMIDEKQTHASIIFWDIQNESFECPMTAEVAGPLMTEGYDIANRNWDNGYDEPLDENQPVEYHPYVFFTYGSGATLDKFNELDDQRPWNSWANENNMTNPKIVNEYAAVWLDRTGEPTGITVGNYAARMPDATAEERFEFHDDAVVWETEFWRAGRNVVGILQFAGLLHSKPNQAGRTCDVLNPDITVPTMRATAQARLKDAFAPLGIIIHKYDIKTGPGRTHTFPVVLVNDYNHDVNDVPVTITVKDGEKTLYSKSTKYSLKEAGTEGQDIATQTFTFTTPMAGIADGTVLRVEASYTLGGETVTSLRKLTYDESATEPVSVGKPAVASSEGIMEEGVPGAIPGERWKAEYVNDGKTGTRWGANGKEEDGLNSSWITIDLGVPHIIDSVELNWEAAFAKGYKIQVSNDNVSFTDIYTKTDGKGGTEKLTITGDNRTGRYVRMQTTEAGDARYAVSLWEFTIRGVPTIQTVQGKVTKDRSLGKLPLENLTVELYPAGTAEFTPDKLLASARTNAEGAYTMTKALADGVYLLRVAGVAEQYGDATATLTVARGQTNAEDLALTGIGIFVPVTKVTIDKETMSLFTGSKDQLTAAVTPENATNQKVLWSSDNETVATVDQTGLVTALTNGTAVITATSEDGSLYDISTVTVTTYSGGSSSGSSDTSTTVKNEDGSTTKTVTNKNTGTVTETTTMPNGDKTVVETKKDGTVTKKITNKDGYRSESVTMPDGSFTGKVTDASGVKTETTITALGETTAKVTLPMNAESAKVTIPVKEPKPGVVAVIVHADGTEELVKTSVVTADGVKFIATGDIAIKLIDNSKGFADMRSGHWATDAVQFAASRELFNGTGKDTFSPEADMSRAMLVTVLARLDGQDTTTGDTWYAAAVDWAKKLGISDGTGLDGVISREQLAVMLYRYAKAEKTEADLKSFPDADSVSDWAAEAVAWAVKTGIITGKGGALDPNGNATRAEVATMLERFVAQLAS